MYHSSADLRLGMTPDAAGLRAGSVVERIRHDR
jgi:hypothetical protein